MIGASSRFSPAMNVMVMAAQKAARGLVRDFGELERLQISSKGFGDFVTTADKRSEKILIDELSRARPDYSILSEEYGFKSVHQKANANISGEESEFCWIIDPLDGTTNFCHGIPYFAVSIALKKENEVIAGVVFNPITDELFCAEKGRGAFLNLERIRVSGRKVVEECLVVTGSTFGFRGEANAGERLQGVSHKIGNIRHFGANSLDLAGVAAGRCDGFFEKKIPLWDCAAGMILVSEAGGTVSTFQDGSFIASNVTIHESLKDVIGFKN